MEIIQSIRIPVGELNDVLHYRLICETMCSSKWQTGKIQRMFKQEFLPAEREKCRQIYRKAYAWSLRTLPVEPVEMYMYEYELWIRLKDFILKYA